MTNFFPRILQLMALLGLLLAARFASAQAPGNALALDGNSDYVSIPHDAAFNIPTTITLEAWVRTSDSGERYVTTKGDNSWYLAVNGGNVAAGKASFYLSGPSLVGNWLYGTTNVADGRWHYLAGTYDGATLKIFVDGVLENSRAATGSILVGTNPVAIGARTNVSLATSGFWSGSLDEIRIWNTDRSSQIGADMRNVVSPGAAGLVAYYTFDQGTAAGFNYAQTTLPDQTTGHHDGSLQGTFNLGSGNTTSNWVESYAMVVPGALSPSAVTATGFTASWAAPGVGTVDNYLVDVATAADFSTAALVSGSPFTAGGTSRALTGLDVSNNTYYYRVRANKASVSGQGASSAIMAVPRLVPLSPPGNALAFDGTNDYVHSDAPLPATGELTLEGWVNPAAFGGGLTGFVMSDNFPAAAMHCQFNGANGGGLNFTVNGNVPTDVASTLALSLGRWSHVAVVYSAGAKTVQFYLNGVLSFSAAYSTAQPLVASTYSIGGWLSGSIQRPFSGRLDEVRIYQAALTPAQILADMTSTSAAVPGSLAAYYDFDQGTHGGTNTGLTTAPNQAGGYATLNNFALTGPTSNYVESYALVLPTATAATGISATGFTANWTAPALGTVDNYLVDVATAADFSAAALVSGSPFTAGGTSRALTGLDVSNTTYYYRVRASKASVSGQGASSATIAVPRLVPLSPPGNALAFDGTNDYVTGTTPLLPQGNAPRTLEAWVLTTTTTGGVILNYGTATNNLRSGILVNGAGHLYYVGEFNDLEGIKTLNDGRWHHVAATYNGTTLSLYVDGVLDITANPAAYSTSGSSWRIGSRILVGTGLSEQLNGRVDEVRVWDVARTPAQLLAGMTAPVSPTAPGLVMYYDFDQGTSAGNNAALTTVPDRAAPNTSGSLTNMALSSGNITSNYVESYALVVPTNLTATSLTSTGFTASWTAPVTGTIGSYVLEVSTSGTFTAAVAGSPFTVAAVTSSQAVSGLMAGSVYFYRVRAEKASVTNQGAYTSVQSVLTPGPALAPPGNALSFDGSNDYVSVPSQNLQFGTGDFTLEAWVRTTSTAHILVLGTSGGADCWLGMYQNQARCVVNGSGPMSSTFINDGRWHHIAGVRASGIITIYVDGVAEGSVANAQAAVPASPLSIGRYGSSPTNYYWNGSLDEVRIWTVARTAAQLRASVTNVPTLPQTGLLAYYNFDQGTAGGSNPTVLGLADLSGTANAGTLNNFALSGNSSNWVESYALVVPELTAATGSTCTGFTANWTAPAVGTVSSYLLDVATSADFSAASLLGGAPISVAAGSSSQAVSGLDPAQTYYYRVRADKASVSGQGGSLGLGQRPPTAPAPAPPGNALAFDGANDYVAVAAQPSLNNLGLGSFTLETWVYVTSLTPVHSLIRKDGDYNLYLNPGGFLGVDVWSGGMGNPARAYMVTPTAMLANRWNHVAAVWNGSAIRLYLNGVDVSSTQQSSPVGTVAPLWLGRSLTYNQPLSGRLDELRIYNAALSPAQVQADMTNTGAAVPASLLLYYNFDQGTAGGTNTDLTTVLNQANPSAGSGALTNFTLSSGNTTSNYVESYALLRPTATTASGITGTDFTANFTPATIDGAAPAAGKVEGYVLDVASTPDFSGGLVSGSPFSLAPGSTSQAVSGLTPGSIYYYRVRAEKASVSNQGAYSSVQSVLTPGPAPTPPGNALNFDGSNDYVSVPSQSLQFGTGDFTLEAWVRTTVTTGTLVAVGASGGTDCWLGISLNQARCGMGGIEAYGTTLINDGRWHHLAGVRAGGILTIYVDGVAEGSRINAAVVSPTSTLSIGRYGGNATNYWSGSLDEVRIWNVARTAAQLRASVMNVPTLPQPGLLAYYNFDQGMAGGSNASVLGLPDLSGNGSAGALTNFALTGSTSNWIESYALVVPALSAATSPTSTGFTANWTAPAVGTVDNYLLDVATSADFSAASLLGGAPISVAAGSSSQAVSGLDPAQTYYYRVRADKASVSGQGGSLGLGQRPPTAPAPAPPGNALAFDGTNDNIIVNNLPAANNLGRDGFTLETWVYYTTSVPNNDLIHKAGDYSLVVRGGGVLAAEIWYQGLGTSSYYYVTTPGGAVPLNRWTHVAATWNGNTCVLYVNGVAAATNPAGTGAYAGAEPLTLGYSNLFNEPLNGRLDETRIYNTALSAAQVRADMTSTVAAVPASLLLYYNYDLGTAGGSNGAFSTVPNLAGPAGYGVLGNFALSGATSNYLESYALLQPTAPAASAPGSTGFTLSFTAPTIDGAAPAAGKVEGYVLDLSTSATFASAAPGSPFALSGYGSTSVAVTGLADGTDYFYRVRAEKASVSNQGTYTATQMATTIGTQALLVSLVPSVGSLTPNFASGITSYTLGLPAGTTTFTLTPTVSSPHANLTLNGTPLASGTVSAALTAGSLVTIVVTSPDGLTTATYTVQTVVAPTYFRSVTSGSWADLGTWEGSNDNTSWSPVPVPPAAAALSTVTIRSGHTVTVAADVSINRTTVQNGGTLTVASGSTLTVRFNANPDLAVQSGGLLTVPAGAVLSVGQLSAGLSGTSSFLGTISLTGAGALTVAGTVVLNTGSTSATAQGFSASTTVVNSTGRIIHFATSGAAVLPIATWNPGATLELGGGIGNQTYSTAGLSTTYQNVDINLANLPVGTPTLVQPWIWSATALPTISGTLTVRSTGLGTLRLFSSASTGSLTLGSVDGNGTRSGGYVQLAGTNVVGSLGGSSTLVGTVVNVLGSFQLTGGTFAANQAQTAVLTSLRPNPLAVAGDFTVASGATFNVLSAAVGPTQPYNVGAVTLSGNFANAGTVNNPNSSPTIPAVGPRFVFAKAGTQTFLNTGTISGRVNALVNAGTTLDLGTSLFTGTGYFTTLTSGNIVPTLRLGHPEGLSTGTAASGNVQSTGTRTFAGGTSYVFSGTVPQTLGADFPVATLNDTNARLVFDNPAGVTLATPVSTNAGTLQLKQGVVTSTGTNLLTLGSSLSSPGTLDATAGNTGRVAGPFRRWVAASTGPRDFPVGTAAVARPARIDYTTAPTTGGTLTARFASSDAGDQGLPLTEGSLTVTKAADEGYWGFTAADGLDGGTYTATFTFTGITGVSNYAETLLLKRPNPAADWALPGTPVATTGSNAAPVLSRADLTGFSDFTAGFNQAPLPVELTRFTAERQGSSALLRWATASEKNSARFEIERSADGQRFVKIGEVAAAGYSARLRAYEFTTGPNQPLAYFRLRQVDADGRFSYSPVRAVQFGKTEIMAGTLHAAPNPFSDQLTLMLDLPQALPGATLSLTDATGRTLLRRDVTAPAGASQLALPGLAGLAPGLYVLHLAVPGQPGQRLKVVKE